MEIQKIYIYIEHVLLVKKKYHVEFLRRKKIVGSRNQGVAKDVFAGYVTALKVAVSHVYMIQGWASHFLMCDLVF